MDAVSSRTTIAELLASHPRVRDILAAKGIDTCCGGSLTLAQAAEARGIPVTELVEALTGSTSRPPLVHRSDTVRHVLATYPGTASVFEKHGLMGCGGTAGPDERIDLFAVIHRVDVAQLLAELNDAVERPSPHDTRPALEQAAPVYPAFLKAALVATMTLGATFGAYNLLVIHWALGPIPAAHTWTHAAFQLWGFTLLFIMGVSYHALPRFFSVNLQIPALARSTLWISIAALLLVTWGRFDEALPAAVPALGAGAALQFLAVLGWAIVLSATWRHAAPGPDLFQPFLAAGTLWWLVAAALLAAGAGSAAWHGGTAWAADWNEAVYAAALYGGTLGWIQGMFLRTGPVFLNLPPTRPRTVALAFWTGQIGAALTTLGGAMIGHARAELLTDAGLLAAGASVAAFVVGVRPFSSRGGELTPRDREFVRLVRLAFGALVLFAALAVSYAGAELAGRTPERLVYDGMRHAFALGFVTVMIVAMAGRIVPIFGGADLRWPVLRAWGGYLIALSLLLREAEVAVAWLGAPWLLNVSGASGIVAAAGVCAASFSILGTLHAASRLDEEPIAPATIPIAADVNVARLIAAHPEALPILVEAGFTPLANPVLRRTLARAVTLREACRMRSIDLEGILERLRGVCPHGGASPTPASPAPFNRGQPPPRDTLPLDPETALGVLRDVIDPELGMNVIDLGLIYDLTVSANGVAAVRMTVTSPGCPHAQHLVDAVHQALSAVPSLRAVDVDLVFQPPWSPDRILPAARARLGLPVEGATMKAERS